MRDFEAMQHGWGGFGLGWLYAERDREWNNQLRGKSFPGGVNDAIMTQCVVFRRAKGPSRGNR